MIRAANGHDSMLQQPMLHLVAPNPYVASILESADKERSLKAAIPRQVTVSRHHLQLLATRQACCRRRLFTERVWWLCRWRPGI